MTQNTETQAVLALMKDLPGNKWQLVQDRGLVLMIVHAEDHDYVVCTLSGAGLPEGHFIAAARDLVPALLAERDAARAEVAALTSPLSVNLSIIPDGWWLYGLFHNHTPIRFTGETHVPFDQAELGDPWTCRLQHVKGGRLTTGSGLTPEEALRDAVRKVAE